MSKSIYVKSLRMNGTNVPAEIFFISFIAGTGGWIGSLKGCRASTNARTVFGITRNTCSRIETASLSLSLDQATALLQAAIRTPLRDPLIKAVT
jgi:hypothetical protein